MSRNKFEWNDAKNQDNFLKHGVTFEQAQYAFADPHRVIAQDVSHSLSETRYYCFGKIREGILTVRFTLRRDCIRIIGAGFWRRGRRIYETKNKIH